MVSSLSMPHLGLLITVFSVPTLAKTYHFYSEEKDWPDSEAACQSLGLELATIIKTEEIAQFTSFLQGQGSPAHSRIWMGLRLPGTSEREEDLEWVDGSTVVVENWDSDEPNNLDRMKCVLIQADDDYRWNTRPCDETHPFVCQTKQKLDNPKFGLFRLTPWVPAPGCSYPTETVLRSNSSAIGCAVRCLRDTRCHVFTFSQSECTLTLDFYMVPCYCDSATLCLIYTKF